MAIFTRNSSYDPTKTVSIINAEICETFTIYIIQVTVDKYKWQVKRRYNDFCQLNEKLCEKFKSLNKSILPRKKLFGNNSMKFVKQRQSQLETYLQIILKCLTFVPSEISIFLEFNKYEIHGIIQSLSESLYNQSDIIILKDKPFTLTPLQLHSLTQRLLLAEPTCDSDDVKRDIGHLLDFVTRVKHLQINGSILPCGTSNIIMNELHFNISNFKSLISLRIFGANLKNIDNVDHIKNSLSFIRVGHCLKYIKDFLLIGYEGDVTWPKLQPYIQPWTSLFSADFSQNRITSIDESIRLVPNLKALNLSNNQLIDVEHLQHLIQLEIIDLSYNNISSIDGLNIKFGNISTIVMSHNKLDSLKGFAKLYSLIHLDVSYNKLSQIDEIKCIQNLPCLIFLDMRNNTVQATIDYKLLVLEWFAERAKEIILDGKRVTSQEVETVAIRLALRKSKLGENKEKNLLNSVNSVRTAENTETTHQITSSVDIINDKTHNLEINWMTGEKPKMSDIKDLIQNQLNEDITEESTRFHFERNTDKNVVLFTEDIDDLNKDFSAKNLMKKDYLSFENNKIENSNFKIIKDAFGFKRLGNSTINYSIKMYDNTSKNSYFLLPETLPGVSSKKLISLLTRLIPERENQDGEMDKDAGMLVMWCMLILISNEQKSEFPGCVYLVGEYVHFFKVLNQPTSNANIPRLRHIASFPFKALTLLVSQDSSYIQICDSEQPNIYIVLLMQSSIKSDYFIEMVKKAKKKKVPTATLS